MNLLLDNIVFSLQPTGGISIVWSELLKRAAVDTDIHLQVLDYPHHNTQRNALSLPAEALLSLPYRHLERYRQAAFHPASNTIFHSSYFRTLSGCTNVTTVHDLTYHFYRHGLPRWVHLWEEERALRQSERVICVSENTRQDLLRIYPWLNENHLSVVYNGVSEVFCPMSVQNSVTPFEQGSYLLYVGNRRAAYKRWTVAVDVARHLQMPLVLVGTPLTKEEQTYLTSQLGTGHFACTGVLAEQQLNQVYNQAFALVYPSDYEGFGIPIVEAQRCGCPVIAQAVSSLPEVAGEGALLVEPTDVQPLLVESMVDLLDDLRQGRISQSKLQQKGFSNAKRFSWDQTYKQTKKVYLSI